MEMKFTASIVEALQCILKLERGNLFIYPKGTDLSSKPVPSPTRVEAPIWRDFHFFSFIRATKIRFTRHIEPIEGRRCGSWMLERQVLFFHRGRRIALVKLVGQKLDVRDKKDFDNDSSWAVKSFGYYRYGGDVPTDWKEVELAETGMTMHHLF